MIIYNNDESDDIETLIDIVHYFPLERCDNNANKDTSMISSALSLGMKGVVGFIL